MADFVGDKQPRKLLGITTRKQGAVNREDHPIAALRKIARDFASGVSALSRLMGQPQHSSTVTKTAQTTTQHTVEKTNTERDRHVRHNLTIDRPGRTTQQSSNMTRLTERVGQTATNRTNQLSTFLKEIQAGFSYKKLDMLRLHSTQALSQPITDKLVTITTPTPIRIPTTRLSGQRARSITTHRASPIALGADKEARHHIDGQPTGRSADLPSAARLAQIVRASELMRSGEVRSHPQVHRWADAIRAGKRREIADIDPERVERVLHDSMGGREAAQQRLNTPEINQLIDRHHSTLQTIQTGLRETEKLIERRSPTRRSRSLPADKHHESTQASVIAPQSYSGLMAPTPAEQRTETKLAEMLATNEEPHLYAEDSERRQIMANSSDVPPTAPTSAKEGRVATSDFTAKRSVTPSLSAPSRREVPSAITAPPQRSTSQQMDMNYPNKERKKERMELSGTMTLVSRGQPIGDMRVQAELR